MTAQSRTDALIQDLNTRLIAGTTATATLLAWCEEHGLSQGPITVERQEQAVLSAAPGDIRAALSPGASETVHYRRVRLLRGSLPLAKAENWFVPERLSAGMVSAMQTTNIPFGTIVLPLQPIRRTLGARARPIGSGPAESPSRFGASEHPSQPAIILEHDAVAFSGSGRALALVKESFFSGLLSFEVLKPSLRQSRDTICRAEAINESCVT